MDLTPLAQYLQEDFTAQSLAERIAGKFGLEVTAEELSGDPQAVSETIGRKVQSAYRRREIEYPVEYAMDMTIGQGGPDNVYALGNLATWANTKYDAGLSVEDLQRQDPQEIHSRLV